MPRAGRVGGGRPGGARGFREQNDRGRVWRLHRNPAQGGGGEHRGGEDQSRVQGDPDILCLLAIRRGQADQAVNVYWIHLLVNIPTIQICHSEPSQY